MKLSITMENEMKRMIKCINSSIKQDQLESCERMILNFCHINRENDKIPFVKSTLYGALILREIQLN